MLGDSDYKDKASVAATKAWANFIISKDCTDLGKSDAFIPIEGNLLKIATAAIAKPNAGKESVFRLVACADKSTAAIAAARKTDGDGRTNAMKHPRAIAVAMIR